METSELAKLIDQYIGEGFAPERTIGILAMVEEAINKTAEHIASNWQDDAMADEVSLIATRIRRVIIAVVKDWKGLIQT